MNKIQQAEERGYIKGQDSMVKEIQYLEKELDNLKDAQKKSAMYERAELVKASAQAFEAIARALQYTQPK
jgi:hypothetical protein